MSDSLETEAESILADPDSSIDDRLLAATYMNTEVLLQFVRQFAAALERLGNHPMMKMVPGFSDATRKP